MIYINLESAKFKNNIKIIIRCENVSTVTELHSGAALPASSDRSRHIPPVLPPGACPTLPFAPDRPPRPTAAGHGEFTIFQEQDTSR